jgi:hypothetical protein
MRVFLGRLGSAALGEATGEAFGRVSRKREGRIPRKSKKERAAAVHVQEGPAQGDVLVTPFA